MNETFGEDFQRLVLAAAAFGDLLEKLPLSPEFFASNSGSLAQTPHQRIAVALGEYWAEYRSRPSREVLAQVMSEASAKLGPEERAAMDREATALLGSSAPADARFVEDRVRSWVELRALERGLIQAADLLSRDGVAGLAPAREVLSRAAQKLDDESGKQIRFVAGGEERLSAWRRGDEYGERITTGFAGLDSVLGGGPTRKESWYFLAPPKGAKTTALLTVAAAAARRRFGVYVNTFEMQALRMALRLDRSMSRSSKDELRSDTKRLELTLDGLRMSGAGEIVIDEWPSQLKGSVDLVNRGIDRVRRGGGRVDVVVLDYLNIMGASREEREKRHELSRISRDIGKLAREQDVLAWSAALVNRKAVDKRVIRKNDIAEAYEVISVADGLAAICGTLQMIRAGLRRLYVVAAREEADEVRAGDYRVDFTRMTVTPADGEVDALPDTEGEEEQT